MSIHRSRPLAAGDLSKWTICCLLRWITFFEVYNFLVEVDNFPHMLGSVVVLADTAIVEVVFAEGSRLTVAVENPVVSLAALCMVVL